MSGGAMLEVRNLSKTFYGKRPRPFAPRYTVAAVKDVSFDLARGETLGVVGESGCGKSTLARCVLNLIPPSAGSVRFDDRDLTGASHADWRALRRRLQIIFQDPYSSLNPRRRIGQTLAEPLYVHKGIRYRDALPVLRRVLDEVGLPAGTLDRHPHEFSGGQRQRIAIARALVLEPELIVADEAVSALDASVQAQILALLRRIQRERNLSFLFITHDLGVVRFFCDRMLVMYLGQVVEAGPVDALLDTPRHPYTRSLRDAAPIPDVAMRRPLALLKGEIPSPANPPSGCAFHPRCPNATMTCRGATPTLDPNGARSVACFHPISAP